MDYSLLYFDARRRPANRGLPQQRVLYDALRHAILDGRIVGGSRLQASRQLAAELGIARNSVLYAYELLAAEGLVRATRHGTLVTRCALNVEARPPRDQARWAALLSARARTLARGDFASRMLPFSAALPALDAFPFDAWRACLKRAWQAVDADDLGYADVRGHRALRDAISRYLRLTRGVRCCRDQVIVTDGSQNGLDLCARLLADPGDPVWVEDPGYHGARAAFAAAGLAIRPLPVDADGLAVPPDLWRTAPPKLIYVTPSHQYPLGAVMSLERRVALLDRALDCGAMIIEDDYDSEFRHGGEPLPALQGIYEDAPVVYLGTFSKTLFPALRLGFMVVPRGLADAAAQALRNVQRRGHVTDQLALADFLESGQFTAHVRRMRKLYGERQAAVRAQIERQLGGLVTVSHGAGGMHLSLRLDAPVEDTAVAARAHDAGMEVRAISTLLLDRVRADRYNGLMIGYANIAADDAARQVGRLAGVVRAALADAADTGRAA